MFAHRVRSPWGAIAVLVWLGFALGVAVYTLFNPHCHTVYPIYASAAQRWWLSQDIYVRIEEYYRYSPLFAILLAPLAHLPLALGGTLWKLVNFGVYGAGLKAFWKSLLPQASRRYEAAFLLMAFPLSWHSLYIGQANGIMVGLLLLGLAAATRERWNTASAALALAALVKSYALGAGLLLAALYPRRCAPRLAAWLLLGLALPYATQPPAVVTQQYASWMRHLRESSGVNRERQRALDYLFATYGHPFRANDFTLLGVAAGVIVLAWTWQAARRATTRQEVLLRLYVHFALWVALFGPATETCTYIVLAPAVAWSCVTAFTGRASWFRQGLLLVSLFLMGPAVTDIVGPLRHFTITHGSQTIGALLYLGHLLCPVRQRSNAAERPVGAADPVCVQAA